MAKEKQENMKRTPEKYVLDAADQILLYIMKRKSVVGLENPYDSDISEKLIGSNFIKNGEKEYFIDEASNEYIGTQVVAFILLLAGSAVLLDNSARESHFQPRVRESMRQLIMNSQYEKSRNTLAMIQEGIACCGADGPDDYLSLQQPLPTECRDTVTGNPFFHGCVDELTWFFEAKCTWIAVLAMLVAFISVMNVVLSIVLIQALKKEEEQADTYRK